ncbi:fibulin-2-like isoform X2 [Leuresthes tenuis]|uniref:fibulin-2-like isoform X2 n=1 Tax=Leuresthes tenuis TaxID=355514 RepID=UPI003B503437
MNIQRATLFFCLMMLCVDVCLSQRDCTGIDCPALQNCFETVLEKGACCPKCTQRGCTCEGYQYYDCVKAGFQRGKVPEGESYFVDFGSTECSCPLGGGNISCRFIPCAEIPPNCVDVLQPADGCPQCRRIGCAYGNKKYEAGHSFKVDQCRVCHCPNEGGKLMCSPIPGCDLHSVNKPMWATTPENSSPLRDISSGHDTRQVNLGEPFSKLALRNTLPLYKQDPPSFGSEDYDYTLAEPTSSTIKKLAQRLESTIVPPAYPESSYTAIISHDDRRPELRKTQNDPNPERSNKDEVRQSIGPTSTGVRKKTSPTTTERETTENNRLQQEVGDRTMIRHSNRDKVVQEIVKDTAHTNRTNTRVRHFGQHKNGQTTHTRNGNSRPRQEKVLEHQGHLFGKEKQGSYPTAQFREEHGTDPTAQFREEHGTDPTAHFREEHGTDPTAQFREEHGTDPTAQFREEQGKNPTVQSREEQGKTPTVQFREEQGKTPTVQSREEQGKTPTVQSREEQGKKPTVQSREEQGKTPTVQSREEQGKKPTVQSREEQGKTPTVQSREEQGKKPTVQFSATSRAPIRLREDGEELQRQPQTLYNYQSQDMKEDTEVSVKELVKTCCETGQKWASANGHCNNMELPVIDRHSICWTAQQQCCLGSLRESQCLAGINTARAGNMCGEDDNSKCGIDSYKECCGCCALGLQFLKEGHRCEAHQYLDFHCQHIFLSCCEGEERRGHTVRERPALDSTPPPRKESDSLYSKEAFSIGEAQDGENAVEGPVEMEDMDECLIYEGNICHHKCINTPGSFRCECFPGYVLQEDAFTCAQEMVDEENRLKEADRVLMEATSPLPPPSQLAISLNPCEVLFTGNSLCEQQCTPVDGQPQCSCSPGFSLRHDGRSCEDINECLSAHACQFNERCMNTEGSYVCQRLITCPPGYQINNDICEDINECEQRTHNCEVGFDCVNIEGSFRCRPKPRCPVGFSQDTQGNCVDIDECGALTQPCSPGYNCINTAGSFTCNRRIICSRGYHASLDGSRCDDVNECEGNLHQCGEGQHCQNLPGSYRCECQTGYQYDSFRRMCVDVNECWRYPGRLCAQICENTPGSYECSCTSGFRLSADGKNCEDVNECLASPCSQECANLYGSYQCYCRKGYHLREDGHTCEDIDECSQTIGHLCTYKCVNVPGSYQCACPEYGYTMSPNGRSCRDIDECATGAHNCSLAETCYNIQGGYRCLSLSCPPNYNKVSNTRCERISCPNYLECQNSPLRITYYYLSLQSNIVIPAQIFRIGPSPAYSGDNVIVTITQGNEENYFSTRKLNAYTGAVYLQRQVEGPRDFQVTVEMKLWRQGSFTTFQAKIYVFITANSL